MKLIVGLGNPGNEYINTRHNMGFMVIDKILDNLNIKFTKTKHKGIYTQTKIKGNDVIIPSGNDFIGLDDKVIIVTTNQFLNDLNEILE